MNLSSSEQYIALQRGTIDGTLYAPYAGLSYKMFEVVKYLSYPAMYPTIGINFLVNKELWLELPEEYRNILQDEANKLAKYTFEISGPNLDKIAQEEGKKQFSVESIWLSDEKYRDFQKSVMPLWEEWTTKSAYCAQLVKVAKEVAGIK